MTQYRDRVEEVRRQHKARNWSLGVAYIYAHDGVTEIHYNSGKMTHFLGLNKRGKSIEEVVEAGDSWELILSNFSRSMADRGRWDEW
jgi:hypothetical protein